MDLNEENGQVLKDLIMKHPIVFSQSDEDIGLCDAVEHRLPTTDDVPIKVPHRRIPPNQWSKVRDYLKRSLDTKIIWK